MFFNIPSFIYAYFKRNGSATEHNLAKGGPRNEKNISFWPKRRGVFLIPRIAFIINSAGIKIASTSNIVKGLTDYL